MVTSIPHPRASHHLTAAQIRALKKLARGIDRDEGEAIKSRGRAVFRRHASLRAIIAQLKTRRLEKGVSLADIATRCGIAKSNLSRLENNQAMAPTLETLHRYAAALGMRLRIELVGKN